MAGADFIYEDQVDRCPAHEWAVAGILMWLGIDIPQAKAYCGVSTCKAVLICAVKDFKKDIYPTEFRSIQERQ